MAKFDLHQTITDSIVSAIEAGGALPWVRPWTAAGGPRNGASGRAYSGINQLLLSIAGMQYTSNEWFTYDNATKLGGQVRKGEKGTMIVFYSIIKKKGEEDKESSFRLMKYFKVFNRDQIAGLPAPEVKEVSQFSINNAAESFITDTGAVINYGGDSAVYNFVTDQISLPNKTDFVDEGAFYATTFHELIHWTGHNSRLDRLKATPFGSPEYAKEELIAEIGAAFLCAEYGINGMTQHPEYINSWLRVLKNDKRFIFTAASQAQKAVGFFTSAEGETGEGE
jgi:antirestriction protein ArdC